MRSNRLARRIAAAVGGTAIVAMVGLTLNNTLYSYGLHLTTASHSGLIFTITPLFVFGVSLLLGHVRVDRIDVLGDRGLHAGVLEHGVGVEDVETTN